MSSAATHARNVGARVVQAGSLAVVFGLLIAVARVTPSFSGSFGLITAVGLLLLAGMLLSELLDMFGLPHLTGYILAGIAAGPYVLHLVDHETVEKLAPVNTLALSLIAFAGGAELKVDLLKQVFRSLLYSTIVQTLSVWILMAVVFFVATRFIPFTAKLDTSVRIGIALLWGVVAVARSPSATLGIIAQTRPEGPVARFSLSFVMVSDVVVVTLLALMITMTRPLIEPGAGISLTQLQTLGHELLGSVALGTTVGLLLSIYLKLVGGQLLVVLIALGFGLTEGLRYVHFDPLLTFMVAGFVVANMSNQGPKLLHAVEETGSVVFVVFFATAGAHLDIALLKSLWPFAVLLAGSRAMITWVAHQVGARMADDEPVLRRWGWSCLVSQAGLAIGIAVVIERSFPSFGAGFRALAIAVVALNELIGPVLFKFGLDRAGETGKLIEKRLSNPPSLRPGPAH